VRFWVIGLAAAIALGAAFGCGKTNTANNKCASFAGEQLLPQTGGADTTFVLWVELSDTTAGQTLSTMIAQSFLADGVSNNLTLDLVRETNDNLRYLRTFQGSDVCGSGTCTLYFHVIATSSGGCNTGFDTPLFQVAIGPSDDDNDASPDDDTQ